MDAIVVSTDRVDKATNGVAIYVGQCSSLVLAETLHRALVLRTGRRGAVLVSPAAHGGVVHGCVVRCEESVLVTWRTNDHSAMLPDKSSYMPQCLVV